MTAAFAVMGSDCVSMEHIPSQCIFYHDGSEELLTSICFHDFLNGPKDHWECQKSCK